MPESNRAVVDNLVTQFSNPLHCFRELVQNSIDAGSPTVDVWTEFIETEGHEGTIALHVDDYGEGMDEQIIDEEFTRLFASSKEKDLTKIGQFGIGFVSTFALNPEAILVETGRSGEYWEVLFHEDRSFTKTPLDVPVEGTQITIFLTGDIHRYRDLVENIETTLRRWCNHSDTRVTFEDRTPQDGAESTSVIINEPFDVPGDCTATVKHEGTQIVAAYSESPIYGFYNRGLTLEFTDTGDDILGKRAERFAHIAFKIKSRYLEHTLSRETVMRDENFKKAMQLLEDAAEGPLFENLLDELAHLTARGDWSIEEVARYGQLASHLSREPVESLEEAGDVDLLRTVDGRAVSLETTYETWRRDGRVLVAGEPTDLSDRLHAQGVPVVLGEDLQQLSDGPLAAVTHLITRYIFARHESSLYQKFRRFAFSADLESEAESAVVTPDEVYLPVVVDDQVPDKFTHLIEATAELLEVVDRGYAQIGTCTVNSSTSDAPLFVTGRQLDPVMSRPPKHLDADEEKRRHAAALNREHPQFLEAFRLFEKSPRVAAYCLAKSMLLVAERSAEIDAELVECAAGVVSKQTE